MAEDIEKNRSKAEAGEDILLSSHPCPHCHHLTGGTYDRYWSTRGGFGRHSAQEKDCSFSTDNYERAMNRLGVDDGADRSTSYQYSTWYHAAMEPKWAAAYAKQVAEELARREQELAHFARIRPMAELIYACDRAATPQFAISRAEEFVKAYAENVDPLTDALERAKKAMAEATERLSRSERKLAEKT